MNKIKRAIRTCRKARGDNGQDTNFLEESNFLRID